MKTSGVCESCRECAPAQQTAGFAPRNPGIYMTRLANLPASECRCLASPAKTKIKKRRRINGRSSLDAKMLTTPPHQLEGGAVSLPQGRRPVTPAGGARAVPAGRGSSPPLPGGFGNTPGRHYDRSAIGSLDWDRRRRSNGRRNRVPGSASGAERRRWFAAARAAVERR